MTKKISLVLGLLLFAFVLNADSAFSQGKEKSGWSDKSPEEMAKSRADRMKTNLDLTDVQHSQIYSLYLNHFNERKTFREQRKAGDETLKKEMRENRKKNREEMESRIKTVLTDMQYTKWQELRKEKMNTRNERREKRKLQQR